MMHAADRESAIKWISPHSTPRRPGGWLSKWLHCITSGYGWMKTVL